jgi:hypothetical protein
MEMHFPSNFLITVEKIGHDNFPQSFGIFHVIEGKWFDFLLDYKKLLSSSFVS